jgi:hypothetical protein
MTKNTPRNKRVLGLSMYSIGLTGHYLKKELLAKEKKKKKKKKYVQINIST